MVMVMEGVMEVEMVMAAKVMVVAMGARDTEAMVADRGAKDMEAAMEERGTMDKHSSWWVDG